MYRSIELLLESNIYSLNEICHDLDINKNSFLYWKNIGKFNEKNICEFYCNIIQVYSESHGIYGSPRITAVLKEMVLFVQDQKLLKLCIYLVLEALYHLNFHIGNLQ